MLCPKPRNLWVRYNPKGYAIVRLHNGSTLTIMRASHKAKDELICDFTYWEVMLKSRNSSAPCPDMIFLKDLLSEPSVVSLINSRIRLEADDLEERKQLCDPNVGSAHASSLPARS